MLPLLLVCMEHTLDLLHASCWEEKKKQEEKILGSKDLIGMILLGGGREWEWE